MNQLLRFSLGALKNPTRQDLVAAVGEISSSLQSHISLKDVRNKMLLSHSGRKILRERPQINSTTLDIKKLINFPKNTFGYRYALFMQGNNLSADTRAPITYIKSDDPEGDELAYVMLRYRQTHDFIHTLTNVPISVEAEIALKWFEFSQYGLPMTLLAGVFGSMKYHHEDFSKWFEWGIHSGSRAEFLLAEYFEKNLEMDIDDYRKKLKIIPFE
jgi:ubiquinone biosynthesis protein COQ4